MHKFPKARGRTARRQAGQMNKMEAEYREYLRPRLNVGEILAIDYERITFKLADDTRYTPDFFLLMADGTIELHEVKGFLEDDAWVKIKVAAEQHPWFTFRLVRKQAKKHGGGWEVKAVGGAKEDE